MCIIVLKQLYSETRAVLFLVSLLRIANIGLIKNSSFISPRNIILAKKQRSSGINFLASERSQQPVIMDPPKSRTGVPSCLIFENPLNIASSCYTTTPPCHCLAPLVRLYYSHKGPAFLFTAVVQFTVTNSN